MRIFVEMLLLLVFDDEVLEASNAISDAEPGAEDEGCACIKSEHRLDDDRSHRSHEENFGGCPYLARQLSML